MQAEPQAEHHWLHKLVGEWEYEHETPAAPGQPPQKFTGSETVQSLGGLWVVCEGRGTMPGGGAANTMMTLGFDPKKGRYVGTWVGSMMHNLWVYDGSLDAEGRVLTLDTEGPSFTDPAKTARYQDVIEFKDDDYRLLIARTLGDDGKWTEFMTAHYRRKK